MSPVFDQNDISRVQQAADIVDVISEHMSLDKKGSEFVGLCPFHQDHRPSLYVSPAKQIFKCFACGAGGDVFKFIQLRENLAFPEAVQRLADRAGIQIRAQGGGPAKRPAGELDPRTLARLNEWALGYWKAQLWDAAAGAGAREYLARRQISEESARAWKLGLALDEWDGLIRAAKQKRISERMLIAAGLAAARNEGGAYDKFRNRLMFPISDVTGRIVGFGGRTLGDDPAKYMNSPATVLFDKSNHVYGLEAARHEIGTTETAVVVEGYTDVMMAHQFGCRNVVATLGTSFTQGHARLLRRYAKRIVLVFDSDVAGVSAANRALDVCLSQKIDIQLAFVEEGKDPCDYLLTAGAEAFRGVVDRAVDVLDFKWRRLEEGLAAGDTLSDRRAAIEEYLRAVATGVAGGRVDAVTRGLIVSRLAGIIGLTTEQIHRELDRLGGKVARSEAVVRVKNQSVHSTNLEAGYFVKAQRELVEVLLQDASLYARVSDRVSAANFQDPLLREIAEPLFAMLERGEGFELRDVLARIESAQAGSLAVRLHEEGAEKGNATDRLEGALQAFDRRQAELENARAKAILSDGSHDDAALQRIQEAVMKRHKHSQITPGMRNKR